MSTQDTPSPRPGRPSTMRDPRRTICDAAAALFAAKGYDATSLQDVASAVGVTKAGLYHYFATKQDLFDTIVLAVLSDMLDWARARVDVAARPADQVAAFMAGHAAYFAANRDHYRAAFIGRGGDLYVFTPEQMAARRAYTDFLTRILEEGRAAGDFAFEDAPLVARGILGMLNWMTRWYNPTGRKGAEEIAADYASIVLKGIATD
ncbi:TetR family transcriptional regulator [Breoghania corrubedonensis]|uniref:TetR family transcriptional regulator n=1 Tax=Breoghania corrubedonensis TaxID=665038 RepID=A0A2T5V1I3_9HYPH|nr:TetR/AcrR family transcriptional regulator [Breoghania corrubedonensis]PTW57619.1 TetR family transcriptional regulator [Breoghania corrubedonensis]